MKGKRKPLLFLVAIVMCCFSMACVTKSGPFVRNIWCKKPGVLTIEKCYVQSTSTDTVTTIEDSDCTIEELSIFPKDDMTPQPKKQEQTLDPEKTQQPSLPIS